jgi:hypothetical protein
VVDKPAPKIGAIYLIGTGAEIGSWPPVIEAIREMQVEGAGTPQAVKNAEGAVAYFGALVQWRRDAIFMRRVCRFDERDQWIKMESTMAEAHKQLKTRIAGKLAAAMKSGALRLRDSFREHVNRQSGMLVFLTTNWDRLLDEELGLKTPGPSRVQHIHGDISDPDKMLLPGEIMGECYRADAEADGMKRKPLSLTPAVEAASRFVVYGHSLSAIEAELRNAIWLWFSTYPGEPEIVVVARKQDCRDIRDRLLPMLPPRPAGWNVSLEVGGR